MHKKKVLIVDSDSASLSQLRKALVDADYEVLCWDKGEEAVELCETFLPDIILSEVSLPYGDGYSFFRQLKEQPTTQSIPFVFLGTQKRVDERVQTMELGVDDYIIKPFQVDEVVARIEMILEEIELYGQSQHRIEKGFSGNLSEMNLVDLIQTLEVGRKSGILKLCRNSTQGWVYIQEGEVMDASLNDLEAHEALLRMFTWTVGNFQVEMREIDRQKTIPWSNKELISKGVRRVHQWEQLKNQLPSLNSVLVLNSQMPNGQLSEEEQTVMGLVNGNKSVLKIIEESHFDDLKTLEVVKNLYTKGYLLETDSPSVPRAEEYMAQLKKNSFKTKSKTEKILFLFSNLFKRSDKAPKSVPVERRKFERRQVLDRRKHERRRDGPWREKNSIYLTKAELLMIREKLL